jgi:hypothetical protein
MAISQAVNLSALGHDRNGAPAECFPEVLAKLPIPTVFSRGHAGYGFFKLGKYSCAGDGAPTDRPGIH